MVFFAQGLSDPGPCIVHGLGSLTSFRGCVLLVLSVVTLVLSWKSHLSVCRDLLLCRYTATSSLLFTMHGNGNGTLVVKAFRSADLRCTARVCLSDVDVSGT